MELACTKKLAEATGLTLPRTAPDASPDQRWFADIAVFNRKKLMLMMHERTGFSIVLYGLKKAELSDLGGTVAAAIREGLFYLGCSPAAYDLLCPSGTVSLTLGGSANRQITSRICRSLEDLRFHFDELEIPSLVQYPSQIYLDSLSVHQGKKVFIPADSFFNWLTDSLDDSPFCQPAVLLRAELPLYDHIVVRDFWAPVRIPVYGLHEYLLSLFGWRGGHLYEFLDENNTPVFTPSPELSASGSDGTYSINIGQLTEKRDTFTWLYDLGQCWEVRLSVLDRQEALTRYAPVCVRAYGVSPPEECGGQDGYRISAEIVENKNHPLSHEFAARQCGDPRLLPDISLINRRLRTGAYR